MSGVLDSLLQAMERLEADVSGTMSGATDDQGLARQRLHVSLPELYWLLKKSDRVIDQAVLDEAFAFLLSAAQSLASDPEVLPGTELGELILELFTAAVAKISSPGAN